MRRMILVLLPILLAAYLAVGSNAVAESDGGEGLCILRVMTGNRECVLPVNGRYCDWIELVNLSETEVELKGRRLGKGADVREAWPLPDRRLAPGESLVLYCTKEVPDESVRDLVTGFALSSDGELLVLSDAGGAYTQVLEVPQLPKNTVYTRDPEDGSYSVRSVYDEPGIGVRLSAELEPAFSTSGVYISEVMADNVSVYAGENEGYPDWIELYNGSKDRVDLTGWALTDDPAVRRKWVLPEGTVLEPGAYLLIEADGTGDGLHAGFRLSASGERILLSDATGRYVSVLSYRSLPEDASCVRMSDGSLEITMQPSPGTAGGEVKPEPTAVPDPHAPVEGLYLNEVCVSQKGGSDWVELVNESSATIELSGYGLSDSEKHPRKWQFPEGTRIAPGEYLVVHLIGRDGERESGLCAELALSVEKEELLTLCMPDGTVLQRMTLRDQRRGISYGRAAGYDTYRYFEEPTPGSANAAKSRAWCAANVRFSEPGGVKDGPIRLTLSSSAGTRIYYTTNGSVPTEESELYTAPIELSEDTVIKAIACCEDGIPSDPVAYTYIFGEPHSVYIVCVSGKHSALDGSKGIMSTGSNDREVPVYVEIYSPEGERVIAQSCGMRMHGKSSRVKYRQKPFHLTAKSKYGEGKFKAELFSDRDYTEYNSVVMRAAGQDNQGAYMRDALLTGLARNTSVYHQKVEPAVLYLNGRYWGVYYLRERIDGHAIAQFEGYSDPDAINLLDGDDAKPKAGSNAEWNRMLSFVRSADLSRESDLSTLETMCDVDNYLEYVMLQMFIGNRDLNNLRMYMSPEDGRWHWVLYDTDFAALSAEDDVGTWLRSSKVGSITSQSTLLFRALMKNEGVRDRFLTRFGELLATDFSVESVMADIDALVAALEPEMGRECKRWGWSIDKWTDRVEKLRGILRARPQNVIDDLCRAFSLSDTERARYFGEALEQLGA